jgi:hypothetical protein
MCGLCGFAQVDTLEIVMSNKQLTDHLKTMFPNNDRMQWMPKSALKVKTVPSKWFVSPSRTITGFSPVK